MNKDFEYYLEMARPAIGTNGMNFSDKIDKLEAIIDKEIEKKDGPKVDYISFDASNIADEYGILGAGSINLFKELNRRYKSAGWKIDTEVGNKKIYIRLFKQ